ncbi:MAG: GNAT family N-acetyltransferase [Rhodomicrobium sp.]
MIEIAELNNVAAAVQHGLLSQATDIFFATAHQKAFNTPEEKETFLSRWFGNYAEIEPNAFLLAKKNREEVLGYLAGCTNSFSAKASIITNDIGYYSPEFARALRGYPSHFHINVRPSHQGQGIGRQLVSEFKRICKESGSSGIHVVTGASSRAVKWYEREGFIRFDPWSGADSGLACLVHPL